MWAKDMGEGGLYDMYFVSRYQSFRSEDERV